MRDTIEEIGPRPDERVLAGKVAGVLWLSVPPMLCIAQLLPGAMAENWRLLVLISIPAAIWGLICLFVIPWERGRSALVFHLPSALALPYIGVIIAVSGVSRSPFALTCLMLIVFAAYFFPPRAAIPYIVGCLVVQALPLIYDPSAVEDGLLAQLWAAVFVYAAVGGVIMAGKGQLVTLRDKARELSLRDSLTGLANRRAFNELVEEVGKGTRADDTLALLLIDIDEFKAVNSLYGLPGGDRVLQIVSERLSELTRSDDVVVRFGGDEFAIVCRRQTSERGMVRLAERAIEGIRGCGARLGLSGFALTASAGWALYPRDADTVERLVEAADLSLRAAKIAGKDGWKSALDWSPSSVPQELDKPAPSAR